MITRSVHHFRGPLADYECQTGICAISKRCARGRAEHGRVPAPRQYRAFGGDQAAPDTVLADIPVP
jgi:hypothetical protein